MAEHLAQKATDELFSTHTVQNEAAAGAKVGAAD